MKDKVLSRRAKLVLATEIDNYKLEPLSTKNKIMGAVAIVKTQDGETRKVSIDNYNPDDPKGAFTIKYLLSLFEGLNPEERQRMNILFDMGQVLRFTSLVIIQILRMRDFKGEIWE